MTRFKPMPAIIAALTFLLLTAAPSAAGPITVTVSGTWTTTGTTDINAIGPFSISFEVDQQPVPEAADDEGFRFPVAIAFVNGTERAPSTSTAGYFVSSSGTPGFDFRLRDLGGAGNHLQVLGYLPTTAYSGLTSAPTLLELDVEMTNLIADYQPVTGGRYTLRCEDCTYVAVLADGGDGQVPEPATLGVMALALTGLVSLKLRQRA